MRLHRRVMRNRMSVYLLLFIVLCAVLGIAVLWLVFQLFIKWITLD
ncbi:hypothetical protein [Variovorax sp. DAIF25]|jgi:hypothetical protein